MRPFIPPDCDAPRPVSVVWGPWTPFEVAMPEESTSPVPGSPLTDAQLDAIRGRLSRVVDHVRSLGPMGMPDVLPNATAWYSVDVGRLVAEVDRLRGDRP